MIYTTVTSDSSGKLSICEYTFYYYSSFGHSDYSDNVFVKMAYSQQHYKGCRFFSFNLYSFYSCLQSKRSSKIRDVLLTLLSHIYKYCETLRCGIISRGSDGHLIHSMHSSLNVYFRQYLVLSRKLYSIMVRITESGIADAFSDLREMLSINDFYSSL